MTDALDLDVCRTWIGREEQGADVVTPELVKRFRATLDLSPGDAQPGDVAPPAIHWCLAPAAPATAALGPDGHPRRGGFLPPIALPRRMWAGGRLAFGAPIRIGDAVRRLSRIEDVTSKEGRTGSLCFVTVRHLLSVADATVIDERQDIVYRGLEAETRDASRDASAGPAPEPRWSKSVVAGEVMLFRYSALTFNGHRIHYDRRYGLEQEGYPGLVVHGPLQATWLLHYAADLHDKKRPKNFEFRSTAPLFEGAALRLCAAETPSGLRLWTADAAGRPAMSAEATW